jgi:hypothetical protein
MVPDCNRMTDGSVTLVLRKGRSNDLPYQIHYSSKCLFCNHFFYLNHNSNTLASSLTSKHLPNLQNRLAKVLPDQHVNECLGSIVNTLGDVQLGLNTAFGKPFLEILLVVLEIGRSKLGVANQKSFHGDLLRDKVHQAIDALSLLGRSVVQVDLGVVRYCIRL